MGTTATTKRSSQVAALSESGKGANLARLARTLPELRNTGANGAWVADGIRAWIDGEVPSIQAGLGCVGRGGVSAKHAARLERRNALIRAFAEKFLSGLEAGAQAKALALKIHEFEHRVLPGYASRTTPPAHFGSEEIALFALLRTGALVRSDDQLRTILRENSDPHLNSA